MWYQWEHLLAEHEVEVYEVNPKKSANFAKVSGNESKTDVVDAKMLSTFYALLTEEDFCIPVLERQRNSWEQSLGVMK